MRLSGGFRSSENALVQLREIDLSPKPPASVPARGVRPTVPSTYQLHQAAKAAQQRKQVLQRALTIRRVGQFRKKRLLRLFSQTSDLSRSKHYYSF
jgi:hypothetical protein